MKLMIRVNVAQPPEDVLAQFGPELFHRLTPPFPPARVLHYGGNSPGSEVHIRLNVLLAQQDWVAVITEQDFTPGREELFFTDEGKQLPFFLSFWRHKHRVRRLPGGSQIIEDIEFRTPPWLPEALLYPVLWAQFACRRPVYRKVFGPYGRTAAD